MTATRSCMSQVVALLDMNLNREKNASTPSLQLPLDLYDRNRWPHFLIFGRLPSSLKQSTKFSLFILSAQICDHRIFRGIRRGTITARHCTALLVRSLIADSANIVDGEFTREYLQRLTRHVARIELKKEGGAAGRGRGRGFKANCQ